MDNPLRRFAFSTVIRREVPKPITRSHRTLEIIALVLLPVALLVNLDAVNIFFGVDEATRALVALEMDLRGEYLVPTINGVPYLNKPPLWNWMLLPFFSMFGYTEFALRLPMVLSLLFFAGLVYSFNRSFFGRRDALLLALLLPTVGRILIWESFFGYIDIFFSAVVYVNFMVLWRQFRAQQWLRLFAFSYALTAVAFLLKGLPALVFQGITLLTLFGWQRQEFRQLFRPAHFLGMLALLLPLGAYYFAYAREAALGPLFDQLWWESAQRSGIKHGLTNTLLQLVTFPFEMFYHYLPWTLFALAFVRRGFVAELRAHPYLMYCSLVFLTNLFPYWTSPDVYPKYILMLVPLFLTIGFFFYRKYHTELPAHLAEIALVVLVGALALGSCYLPFAPETAEVAGRYWKSALVILSLVVLAVLMVRRKALRLIVAINALLVFRLAFDWFIYPPRGEKWLVHADNAARVVALTEGEPLYYLDQTFVQHGHSYLITRGRGEIIYNHPKLYEYDTWYLTTDAVLEERELIFQEFFRFPKTERNEDLVLVKLFPPG